MDESIGGSSFESIINPLPGGHMPRVFTRTSVEPSGGHGRSERTGGPEEGMLVEEEGDVRRRSEEDDEERARLNLISAAAHGLHGTGASSDVAGTAVPYVNGAPTTTTMTTTTTTTTPENDLEREMLRDMDAMRRRSDLRSFYTERVRAYLRQRHYHFVDDNGEDGDEIARTGSGNAENGNAVNCTSNDASRPGGFLDEACMPGPCESSDAQAWWLRGLCQRLTPLAASASTTDHVSQCASNVLRNDEYFWSSTGSADGRRDECITIRLVEPLNRVRAVAVAPFRARFQFGEPVYPPRAISISIGASPNRLVPASPRYRVKKSDFSQLFLLWPSAPPGSYIRITLHGSLQQQLEDMRYYVAVRHVAIFGSKIDTARVAREGLGRSLDDGIGRDVRWRNR